MYHIINGQAYGVRWLCIANSIAWDCVIKYFFNFFMAHALGSGNTPIYLYRSSLLVLEQIESRWRKWRSASWHCIASDLSSNFVHFSISAHECKWPLHGQVQWFRLRLRLPRSTCEWIGFQQNVCTRAKQSRIMRRVEVKEMYVYGMQSSAHGCRLQGHLR